MAKYGKYMHFTVNRYCVFAVVFFALVFCGSCHERMPNKRNAPSASANAEDLDVGNEEYPMVVPKRTAMFLDRLMVALHNALEDNDMEGVERLVSLSRSNNRPSVNEIPRSDREMAQHLKASRENQLGIFEIPVVEGMELQRRGNDDGLGAMKGRKYWRCYFNAVTCF